VPLALKSENSFVSTALRRLLTALTKMGLSPLRLWGLVSSVCEDSSSRDGPSDGGSHPSSRRV